MDEDRELLSGFFPPGWEALASGSGALNGLRKGRSAENLQRVLLLYLGCGHAPRETVAVRARRPVVGGVGGPPRLQEGDRRLPTRRQGERHGAGSVPQPAVPPRAHRRWPRDDRRRWRQGPAGCLADRLFGVNAPYSTVTLFARFRGWSMSVPLITAT